MSLWFGHAHRDEFAHALAKAMHRRGEEGIRIALDRGGGLKTVSTTRGRDKAAQLRRRDAFVAFLRIRAELNCTKHAPSAIRYCRWCLCSFRDGVHACVPACGHQDATFTAPCRCRTWEIEHSRPIDAGTLPHEWSPVRCDTCDTVYRNDLDDLRAQLAALDTTPASIATTDAAQHPGGTP